MWAKGDKALRVTAAIGRPSACFLTRECLSIPGYVPGVLLIVNVSSCAFLLYFHRWYLLYWYAVCAGLCHLYDCSFQRMVLMPFPRNLLPTHCAVLLSCALFYASFFSGWLGAQLGPTRRHRFAFGMQLLLQPGHVLLLTRHGDYT